MARSLRDAVLSLPPYHLISWGSLLGMELYQVSYDGVPSHAPSSDPRTSNLFSRP